MMPAVINLDGHRQQTIIETRALTKKYPNGTVAVNEISFEARSGEFIAVIGSSGAGKSTLLRCINRLVEPTSGSIFLAGENITSVNGHGLKRARQRIGMIFQQFHLVKRLSVLDNVLAGRLRFAGFPAGYVASIFKIFPESEKEKAFACLEQVGIAELAFQRADTLSGGQQQRVAIARALAQEPDVFLADEPIASLDPGSSSTVMDTLMHIHETRGIPVIVNLHHLDYARRYATRIIGMKAGSVIFDGSSSELVMEATCGIYGCDPDGSSSKAYA